MLLVLLVLLVLLMLPVLLMRLVLLGLLGDTGQRVLVFGLQARDRFIFRCCVGSGHAAGNSSTPLVKASLISGLVSLSSSYDGSVRCFFDDA